MFQQRLPFFARPSLSDFRAVIFGGTGFLGHYVAYEFGRNNAPCIIPNRGCELETRSLKVFFDVGQVAFPFYHIFDRDSLRYAMREADVVINLVGKHYETKHIVFSRDPETGKLSRVNFSLHDVHVKGARTIAEVAKEAGIKRFVHVSSLIADENSPSEWARTKALGEKAVRDIFPESVIVRPSVMFGYEDRFLNEICQIATKFRCVPMVNHGKALLQPACVYDVAAAIFKAATNDSFDGKTLELAGDIEYSHKEIIEFALDLACLEFQPINLPPKLADMLGWISDCFPNPSYTQDQMILMGLDQLLDPNSPHLKFSDLGIVPERMEKVAFEYLHRFRPGGLYQHIEA